VKKVNQVNEIKKTSIWDDRVVRVLGALIALVVVGALLTLISMIITGVIPLGFTPQTSQDADIEQYRYVVDKDQDPESWSKLIIALARSGKIKEANQQMESFKASEPDVTQTQGIAYAQATILMMEERFDEALVILEQVRQDLWDAYQKELASKKEMNWASSQGIPVNYFHATMDMADIFIAQGRDTEALEMFDDYLEKLPTDASTFIKRARLKLRMGDLDGAESDFLAAQRFLPDDTDIIDGLEEIKAVR